jgi:hypothetical protein
MDKLQKSVESEEELLDVFNNLSFTNFTDFSNYIENITKDQYMSDYIKSEYDKSFYDNHQTCLGVNYDIYKNRKMVKSQDKTQNKITNKILNDSTIPYNWLKKNHNTDLIKERLRKKLNK